MRPRSIARVAAGALSPAQQPGSGPAVTIESSQVEPPKHGPELFPRRTGLPQRSARLAGRQPAGRHPRQGHRLPAPGQGRPPALAQDPGRQGLVGAALAQGMGRHRLEHHPALHLRRGIRPGRRADARALRPCDVRLGAAALRHRRAEEPLPAAHPRRRRLLGAGLFRARRRFRSGGAEDARRARRRLLPSSPARRSGPRWATTATGSSAWCAPMPRPRSARKASASC